MILKNPPLEIPDANPFLNDKLKRDVSAKNLSMIFKLIEEPFVLSINGSYGSGKTVFVNMLSKYLENSLGLNSIYFNAWEHDFSDDPLICFIAELENIIDKKFTHNKKARLKSRLKTIKKYSGKFIKSAIPAALSIATHGILNLDDFSKEKIAGFIESFTEQEINNYEQSKKGLENFRKKLKEIVQIMEKPDDFKSAHLVIFVDELDRCKPTFTVELIERIKHFFSVEGIIFVLSVDKSQLSTSIESFYGDKIDTDGYLRRFIDLEFSLPEPNRVEFCQHLFSRLNLNNILTEDHGGFRHYELTTLIRKFATFSNVFNFSLRFQEQCFIQFSIIIRTHNTSFSLHADFLAFLIALKAYNDELYYGYCNENKSYKDILPIFYKSEVGRYYMSHQDGWLLEVYLESGHFKKSENYTNLVEKYKKDQNDKSQYMLTIIKEFRGDRINSMVKELFNKIEMVEGFRILRD